MKIARLPQSVSSFASHSPLGRAKGLSPTVIGKKLGIARSSVNRMLGEAEEAT